MQPLPINSVLSLNENLSFNKPSWVIGSQEVADRVASQLPYSLEVQSADSVEDVIFQRDCAILRMDGSLLIPYVFKASDVDIQLRALLPKDSCMMDSIRCGFGTGFDANLSKKAAEWARSKKCEVQPSICALEGGNCYLFHDLQGRSTALIGNHSLFLTLLAMEEQGYFNNPYSDEKILPSEQAYLMARNWSLYQTCRPFYLREKAIYAEIKLLSQNLILNGNQIKELQKEKNEIDHHLRESQLTFIHLKEKFKQSVFDKESFYEEAILFEKKLSLAKEAISRDLQVPLERIAFIKQSRFHIDMEIFVANSQVYMQSEKLCIESIGKRRDLSVYLEASQKKVAMNEFQLQFNRQEISKLGLNIVLVPGCYEASGKKTINFMNGLVVSNTFYTNRTDNAFWAEAAFNDKVGLLKVNYVGNGILGKVLTDCNAGLRCLTREVSNLNFEGNV